MAVFLKQLTEGFKGLEFELLVYKAVIESMKTVMGVEPEMEQLLQMARKNQAIQKMVDEKYDKPLEEALQLLDQLAADQALLEILKTWKPKGPPN